MRQAVRAIVALTLAIALTVGALQFDDLRTKWGLIVGSTVSIALAAKWLWDTWLWQLAARFSTRARPNLRGTWKGEITFRPEGEGTAKETKVAYLSIEQTFTEIHLRLLTDFAVSDTEFGRLIRSDAGDWSLWYSYRAEAAPDLVVDNPGHFGSGRLQLINAGSCRRLDGHYWNDRWRVGTLRLEKHETQRAKTFGDAQKLFQTAIL